MPICIIGCLLNCSIAFLTFTWTAEMDRALNYSMKKKIRTKKIPLWFPSDRKNESAFGPSLEEPNEGTYLPAFVSCIITYAILFASVIAQIVVHCVVKVDKVDAYMILGTSAANILNTCVVRSIVEHYVRKYSWNKPYYMNKISAIQKDKDKDDKQRK